MLISNRAVALHNLEKRANSSALASPGLFVVDPLTDQPIAQNGADSQRVPASVLKLFTMTVVLQNFDPNTRYVTSIWNTEKENEFLIRGSLDPFLTPYKSVAEKYGHGYLMGIINKANSQNLRKFKIAYTDLYPGDIKNLTNAFKNQKLKVTFEKITNEEANSRGITEIASLTSKPLSRMVSHTILWSDNLVADRLAKAVTKYVGNETTGAGITRTYRSSLATLGIPVKDLVIKDGSGLSKKNRITARATVELLRAIRNNPQYSSIYEGLPISGETGTLKTRFTKAPAAIGHVHAKTGWVNRSVTMAGYVESGDKEYVFAILADGISPTLSARNAARRAMDKFLETVVTANHQIL
ncbi:MAG: D-alanyl-D-alanine carboxypeptidase [Actinomycetales bacterium]